MAPKIAESATLIAPSAFAKEVGVLPSSILKALDNGRFSKKVIVKVGKRVKLRRLLARAEWYAYKGLTDPEAGAAPADGAKVAAPTERRQRARQTAPDPAEPFASPFDLDPEDEAASAAGTRPKRAVPVGWDKIAGGDEDEDDDGAADDGYEYDVRLGMNLPKGSLNDLRARNEAIKAAKGEVELRQLLGQLVSVDEARRALFAIGQEVRTKFEAMPARIVDELAGKDRFEILSIMEKYINATLSEIGELGNREVTTTNNATS